MHARLTPFLRMLNEGLDLKTVKVRMLAQGLSDPAVMNLVEALAAGENKKVAQHTGADPSFVWEALKLSGGAADSTPIAAVAPEAVPVGNTRFVIISDTHGLHRQMPPLPAGDVLLHCGDFSNTGEEDQIKDFVAWMASQPHRHKVIIAGNHDTTMHPVYYESTGRKRFHGDGYDVAKVRDLLTAHPTLTYLEDSGAVINGFLVWGSPWQPEFCDWAFNLRRGQECRGPLALVPDDVDVLMTHGPPLGHGEVTSSGVHVGCEDLRWDLATRFRSCRLHASGHVHESHGLRSSADGRVIFANASSCTRAYKPTNAPLVVDLQTPSEAEAARNVASLRAASKVVGERKERAVRTVPELLAIAATRRRRPRIGDYATLTGLKKAPALNGQACTVLAFLEAKSRFKCRIAHEGGGKAGEKNKAKVLLVRPENVVLRDEEPEPD